MSNDINTKNTISAVQMKANEKTPTEKKQSSTAATSSNISGPTPGESLSVSSQLSRLSELSKTLTDMPVVDASKVAEIKQALADGTLTMDAEKIAQSIISFESDNNNQDS